MEWCRFQDIWLKENIERIKSLPLDKLIYSDEGQTLWEANRGKNKLIAEGSLLCYNNRIVFVSEDNHKYTFKYDDMSDMNIIGQMDIAFATNDRQAYEIKSSYPRSALKYRELFKYLKSNK